MLEIVKCKEGAARWESPSEPEREKINSKNQTWPPACFIRETQFSTNIHTNQSDSGLKSFGPPTVDPNGALQTRAASQFNVTQ